MTTKQLPVDFAELQGAIYGVALSLDAFLVNGIPYGVLQQATFPDFLPKTTNNLMRDLAILEQQAPQATVATPGKVAELLTSLRASCQRLVDLVSGLSSFRTLSIEQVRSAASQISPLRGECVELIQELERGFQTPKPFYQSRPAHSTAAVNEFLTDLERLFVEEWHAAR